MPIQEPEPKPKLKPKPKPKIDVEELIKRGTHFIEDGEILRVPGALVPLETVVKEIKDGVHHVD